MNSVNNLRMYAQFLTAIHFCISVSWTDQVNVASVLYMSQYDNFILLPGNNRNIISNETNKLTIMLS